jgi:hypothetical protein
MSLDELDFVGLQRMNLPDSIIIQTQVQIFKRKLTNYLYCHDESDGGTVLPRIQI